MSALQSKRKVLVVDSEPSVCSVIGECMAEWPGTEVSCVTNGTLAARALQTMHYDLVLIEAILPGVPDLSLVEIATDRNTPVLIFSGHPGAIEMLDTIGCPCVAKPFSLGDLIERSQQAVAGARENIERARISTARLRASGKALTAAMMLSARQKNSIENRANALRLRRPN